MLLSLIWIPVKCSAERDVSDTVAAARDDAWRFQLVIRADILDGVVKSVIKMSHVVMYEPFVSPTAHIPDGFNLLMALLPELVDEILSHLQHDKKAL